MTDTGRPAQGQLVRSVSWLAVSFVVSKISTLIAVFALGHYLGEEFFGRFAIAFALPAALESLADLGISWALVREGAGRRGELSDLAIGALLPKLALGSLMVATTVAVAMLLRLPAEVVEAALYLGVARALDSLTYLARSVFQAGEKMQYDAASFTVDGAVRLLLVLYGIASGFGVVGFAKAFAVASAITVAGTWIVAGHQFLRPSGRIAIPGRLIASGLPLAVVWLLDNAVIRVGVILVGLQVGNAPAGGLAAALRIIEPLLGIPALFVSALLPLTTRHIIEERATLPWLLPASVRVGSLVASLATIAMAGLAPTIVGFVFGPLFELAGPLLRLLALALVPLFIRTILIAFLLAMRSQRRLILAQVAGTAANIGLSVALLPSLGPSGAVVGLISGEVISVAIAAVIVPSLRELEIGRAFTVLPALAAGLAALLASAPLGEIPSTAIALAIFVAAVRWLKVIDDRDLRYMERAVPMFGRLGRVLR